MKTKVAVAEWNNATDALKDATTLAIHGQHKGAESRAYFAIEHGARAALAIRNQEPKTHTAVGRAFVNQLIHSGEMTAERSEDVKAARQRRERADYSSFYEGSKDNAHTACARAARFLAETRKYLLTRGLQQAVICSGAQIGAGAHIQYRAFVGPEAESVYQKGSLIERVGEENGLDYHNEGIEVDPSARIHDSS